MKKISFVLILCLVLVFFALPSCSDKPDSNDGKFTVVCSIFPQYDFCRIITGGEDEVILLSENGVDMHSFEPTSRDILTIAKSDMLVYTGGDSDGWVEGALRSAGNRDIATVSLFEFAELISPDSQHHDHEHAGEGDTCHEHDEHVWTSPKNAIRIVRGLCDALSAANPDGAERYEKNTAEYIAELETLDSAYESFFESDPMLVVADRFPFLYLAHDYSVSYHAAFSGCSSETGASFETVLSLIDAVNKHNVGIVFDTDNSGSDVAYRVAQECGVRLGTLYSCQTVTRDQLDMGASYVYFMEKNLETLREAYDVDI